MIRTAIAATCAAAAAVTVTLVVAPAASAASFHCAYTVEHVKSSVDFLKVHSSRSTSSATVGQLPGGAAFCATDIEKGTNWEKGYGYNGSVKVSGWVVGTYLV